MVALNMYGCDGTRVRNSTIINNSALARMQVLNLPVDCLLSSLQGRQPLVSHRRLRRCGFEGGNCHLWPRGAWRQVPGQPDRGSTRGF